MLLNKIPVLDKGYVALIDSMNGTHKFQKMRDEYRIPVSKLEQLTSATMIIRCPVWFQLRLSLSSLTLVGAPNAPMEAYLPNAGEIGSKDRVTNEAISDDIARTTAALLMNPKAYRADGADNFVAQVMTPMNVYTTLLVSGTLPEWRELIGHAGPAQMEAYLLAIKQIINVEWPHGKT
jgi:hypothetical protein